MKTVLMTIKVDPVLKAQAQAVAKNLGFSLSSLIRAYLEDLIKRKTVCFSLKKKIIC